MKRIVILLIVLAVAGGVAWGGYSWQKAKNAPPPPIVYKDIKEANSDIERLKSLNASKGLSWQEEYRLGVAYLQTGRPSEAVPVLNEVLRLRPGFPKTYEALGMAYYRMGNMEKALENWEGAKKITPEARHLDEAISTATRRLQLRQRAVTLEEELKSDALNWGKRFELAILYLGERKTGEARAQLEEVLKHKSDEPSVYDAIAESYAREGDFDAAIKAEKKALKLKPDDEKLKARLSEMEKVKAGMEKGDFHKDKGPKVEAGK